MAAIVDDLRAKTPMRIESGSFDLLGDVMGTHDVVIQGTSVGMYPHAGESLVPKSLLRPGQVVFDMVYRPHKTRLLTDAEEAGCRTILGVEMLINQAVLQFERWTGVDAPVDVMREAVLAALA